MRAALPYGLSVHHFISQVGDYVGFAAIVAVAIMVLLLFAHARETAELRRRAEDAEDELSLLHEQVQWLRGVQQAGGAAQQAGAVGGDATRQAGVENAGAAPATVPAPAAARAASPAGRSVAATTTASAAAGRGSGSTVAPPPAAERSGPVVPGAPVGVGAPALSSATKLIPPTDEELRAVAAAAAAREARAESPATQPGTNAGPGAATAPAPGAPVTTPSAAPVAPPPATVAAGNGNPPGRGSVAAPPGAPRGGAGRASQSGAVVSPRRDYGNSSDRSGGRRVRGAVIAAVTLLIAAIVVVVVLVVGNGGSNKHHAQAATGGSAASKSHNAQGKAGKHGKGKFTAVNVDPTTVTVSVLNGTMTTNLAADVSSKLTAKGFQAGSTGNAADQSMKATVVGYVPGVQNAKNDAYAVAHTLGLSETAVKPVSSANQTVACSGETTCPDQVIVTVGADLNSDAT